MIGSRTGSRERSGIPQKDYSLGQRIRSDRIANRVDARAIILEKPLELADVAAQSDITVLANWKNDEKLVANSPSLMGLHGPCRKGSLIIPYQGLSSIIVAIVHVLWL